MKAYDFMVEEMTMAGDILQDMAGLADSHEMAYTAKRCREAAIHCADMAGRLAVAKKEQDEAPDAESS